jgi:uncharacterized protein YggE
MRLKRTLALAIMAASLMISPAFAATGLVEEKMMPIMPIPGPIVAPTADKTIVVYGYGKVSTTPDKAMLNLNFETEMQTTAKQAGEKLSSGVASIAKDLAKYGIKESDFVSTWYTVYPQYDYSVVPTGKINGYIASASYNLNVSNVAQSQETLDVINATDALRVTSSSINYSLKDTTLAANDARALAIKDAVLRADTIAKLLGVELAGIQKVEDYFYPYNYYGGQNAASLDLELNLTVTYKIK